MNLHKKNDAPRRLTNAQIAGIACGSAVLIGASGFFVCRQVIPSVFPGKLSHNGFSQTADYVLTDTQVRKLSDQVVQDSMEVLSTDILADFIDQAVNATLDSETLETAVSEVLAQGDVTLTDAQQKEIAEQVRKNVEAVWLSLTASGDTFTDDQISFITNLVASEISDVLSNYTLTSNDDIAVSQEESQEAIIKTVLETLFPDNPEFAEGYAAPGKILTEDDIKSILTQLDASSIQELRNMIRSDKGSSLENTADSISGSTVFAKLGSLYKTMEKNAKSSEKAIATAEDAISRAALKDSVDADIRNINNSITQLQSTLKSNNASDIASAKTQLEQSLAALNTTLSSNIANVSSESRSSIASMRDQINALQTTVAAGASNNTTLNNNLTSIKDELTTDMSSLESSLNQEIAGLDEKLKSSTPSELETDGENIAGDTVFGRLGTLWHKITSLGDSLSGSISEETRARESATQTLQSSIDAQVGDVNTAMSTLQRALNDANGANADAITSAKAELNHALDALNSTLSGDISQLDEETQSKITNLNSVVSTLKTSLEGSDDEIRDALNTAKSTFDTQVSDLRVSLTNAVRKETEARVASEAALQAQIRSESNTQLEQVASDKISGATVFGKLGALYNSIGSVKESEGWAQNITLNNTATSGSKIFGIEDSTDPEHTGWKMWRIDDASLGLDFRAKTADTPESEVMVTFSGHPVFIREWGDVEDGYITLYTPTVPDECISISTIHVTNKIAE